MGQWGNTHYCYRDALYISSLGWQQTLVGRLATSSIRSEFSIDSSLPACLRLCKILVIPMTAVLLVNVDAGLGHHIWDLTYPRVMAIGRWSMHAAVCIIRQTLTCQQLTLLPSCGASSCFCSSTASFAYICASFPTYGSSGSFMRSWLSPLRSHFLSLAWLPFSAFLSRLYGISESDPPPNAWTGSSS
jgi:hypothetical protein